MGRNKLVENMTDQERAEHYQKIRDDRDEQLRVSAMHLDDDQREAIKEARDVLQSVVQCCNEIGDVWMSDVNKMESAYFALKNRFPLGDD
jgi:hypothetical protein